MHVYAEVTVILLQTRNMMGLNERNRWLHSVPTWQLLTVPGHQTSVSVANQNMNSLCPKHTLALNRKEENV